MSSTAANDLVPATANLVDRAADSADQALEATRRTANSAIDSVSDTVQAVRSKASTSLNRLTAPLDQVVARTHEAPIQSLLLAAAAGAALVALIGMMRPSR